VRQIASLSLSISRTVYWRIGVLAQASSIVKVRRVERLEWQSPKTFRAVQIGSQRKWESKMADVDQVLATAPADSLLPVGGARPR